MDPPVHFHTLQGIEQFPVVGQNLSGSPSEILSSGEIRLSCRGEYHGGVIPTAQLIHGSEGGGGQIGGKTLGLIEYDNAVGNIVEFSTGCRLVGKQRFKKSDGGGDDDRCTPSGGQFPAAFRKIALTVVDEDIGDNVSIGVGALLC